MGSAKLDPVGAAAHWREHVEMADVPRRQRDSGVTCYFISARTEAAEGNEARRGRAATLRVVGADVGMSVRGRWI